MVTRDRERFEGGEVDPSNGGGELILHGVVGGDEDGPVVRRATGVGNVALALGLRAHHRLGQAILILGRDEGYDEGGMSGGGWG